MTTSEVTRTDYQRLGAVPRELPFVSGDHLDQPTFHQLYQNSPVGVKAELIGGVVYVASPVSVPHSRAHGRLVQWLTAYADETPGTESLDNATTILGETSEPQPDACLRILEDYGGQSSIDSRGYVEGAAEFVAEVAHTTANIDLHAKRKDYEAAGVREYVVVLVDPQRVIWFALGRHGFKECRHDMDGIFRSKVFPGLWLDAASVFGATGRRLLAMLKQGIESPGHASFVKELAARRAARAEPKRRPKT